MSHRNYSKYSEQPKEEVVKTSVEETEAIQEITEENIELTSIDEVKEEVFIDHPIKSEQIIGIVDNTERLRVRKEDNVDSEILCLLDKGSEVTIDSQYSAEFFYKIVTSAGIEGYCMKKFITIK
jgi:hypothetical protein